MQRRKEKKTEQNASHIPNIFRANVRGGRDREKKIELMYPSLIQLSTCSKRMIILLKWVWVVNEIAGFGFVWSYVQKYSRIFYVVCTRTDIHTLITAI